MSDILRYWSDADGEHKVVGEDNRLPVAQYDDGLAVQPPVAGQTIARWATPRGIGTGAAYADKDAIGLVVEFPNLVRPARRTGLLHTALYHDLDDEGLQVDLWLFGSRPAEPTDNSALALSDADLLRVVGVLSFTSFSDAENGQFSQVAGIGLFFRAEGTSLYGIAQARGALNIAADNLPRFTLVVVPD